VRQEADEVEIRMPQMTTQVVSIHHVLFPAAKLAPVSKHLSILFMSTECSEYGAKLTPYFTEAMCHKVT
jgi:hypothetical protein